MCINFNSSYKFVNHNYIKDGNIKVFWHNKFEVYVEIVVTKKEVISIEKSLKRSFMTDEKILKFQLLSWKDLDVTETHKVKFGVLRSMYCDLIPKKKKSK